MMLNQLIQFFLLSVTTTNTPEGESKYPFELNTATSIEASINLKCLAVCPYGKKVAQIEQQNLYLWDVIGDKKIATFEIGQSTECCFGPDGNTFAYSTNYNEINIFNIETHSNYQILKPFLSPIRSLCFNKTGNLLACLEENCTFTLWNIETLQQIVCLEHPYFPVTLQAPLCFSPDDKYIAFSYGDRNLHMLSNISQQKVIIPLKHRIHSLNFSPNGKILACGLSNGSINLIDVETSQLHAQLADNYQDEFSPIIYVHYNPQNDYLVTLSEKGVLRLWHTSTWPRNFSSDIYTFNFSTKSGICITYAQFIHEGKSLAIGTNNNNIFFWNVNKLGIKNYNDWCS